MLDLSRIVDIRKIYVLVISLFGVWLFSFFGLPLPYLFGPMFLCIIAALVRAPIKGFPKLFAYSRTIIGVAVGSSITVALIKSMPQYFLSLIFIPLYIGIIVLIGIPYFRKVCGFDVVTSYFSAMPGSVQDMVIFGKEAGADVRALSLVHATRVLVIVTLAPFVLVYFFDQSLTAAPGSPVVDISILELVLMGIAAIVGWKAAEQVGMFGAAILGPMIVAAIFSLSGYLDNRPPREAVMFAQFFIGIGLGVGYIGITLKELRHYVITGIIFIIILAALAWLFSDIIVRLGLLNPVEGFLSFAPGGQAEMSVLAIVAGAEVGLVVLHHLVRLFTVILGAPIAGRLFGFFK